MATTYSHGRTARPLPILVPHPTLTRQEKSWRSASLYTLAKQALSLLVNNMPWILTRESTSSITWMSVPQINKAPKITFSNIKSMNQDKSIVRMHRIASRSLITLKRNMIQPVIVKICKLKTAMQT